MTEQIGRYRVIGRLGGGGQAEVFRAYDPELRCERAVKMPPPEADPEAEARLEREAQLAATLRHPRICAIHDIGRHAGRLYVVMDLVEGETLRARQHGAPLEAAVAQRIAQQVAGALAYAHGRGVVHRDLSSANVMLTPDDEVVLLDFGLAHRLPGEAAATVTALTASGVVAGTPDYIAPEVLAGGGADARADVWALGIVLHEMLSGTTPFHAGSTTATLARVLQQPPAPLPAGVPRALAGIVERCLEKDPAQRFQSAAELEAALERAGRAPHASATPPAKRPASRPRLRALALAAAVLPVVVLTMVIVAVPVVRERAAGLLAGHPKVQSLAVLPLEDASPARDAAFAEGMTDELTTTLGQIGAITVIASNTARDYDPRRVPLPAIARRLGVGALVTGAVLHSGDQVRITAHLVEGSSGRLMWSQSYERDMRDVIALQNDVSRAIAEQVSARLTPNERAQLMRSRPVDPQMYQDYLRGRVAWTQYSREGFLEAERLFRQALARDSSWAPAWAGLADVVYGLSSMYLPPNVAIPRSRMAAEHALALDSTSAEAHTSIGITRMVYDWEWAGAQQAFERAVALQPGLADAHWWLGHLLVCRGDGKRGLSELRRAMTLDPGNSWYAATYGWHLYQTRRFSESADSLRHLIARDPDAYFAHVFLGVTLEQTGDHAAAVSELEHAVRADVNNDDLAQLGHAYATAGRRADALRMIQLLQARADSTFVPAASFANVYVGLGDREAAMQWITRALNDHSEWLCFAGVDPVFDPLRADPRFAAVLVRLHLNQ